MRHDVLCPLITSEFNTVLIYVGKKTNLIMGRNSLENKLSQNYIDGVK